MFDALLPVFCLILLGAGLRQLEFPGDEFWIGAEKLTYFLLFPSLLFVKLSSGSSASCLAFFHRDPDGREVVQTTMRRIDEGWFNSLRVQRVDGAARIDEVLGTGVDDIYLAMDLEEAGQAGVAALGEGGLTGARAGAVLAAA